MSEKKNLYELIHNYEADFFKVWGLARVNDFIDDTGEIDEDNFYKIMKLEHCMGKKGFTSLKIHQAETSIRELRTAITALSTDLQNGTVEDRYNTNVNLELQEKSLLERMEYLSNLQTAYNKLERGKLIIRYR